MKNALPQIVHYEKTIFGNKKKKKKNNNNNNKNKLQKNNTKKKKNQPVKIRQLEKIFEYFKIQENLPSENVTEYKEYFLYIFSYPKRYYTSTN